jgi:hypothetical protein
MQQLLLRIRAGERVRDWDGEFSFFAACFALRRKGHVERSKG